MAAPPATYPKIDGNPCGQRWGETIQITGKLPGVDFGSQFRRTLEPIFRSYTTVQLIGNDRATQEDLAEKIRAQIDEYRFRLEWWDMGFSDKERKSLEWLLDHSEAELEAADQLWTRWSDRNGGAWPLNLPDAISDFAGGVCTPRRGGDPSPGQWVQQGRVSLRCPTTQEIQQRPLDREAIGARFNDALAHAYCAAYGMWKLYLFHQAAAAYAELPDISARPDGGVGGLDLDITAQGRPLDPCRDLGLNCPPGEEPEGCPSGFCPDPEGLPDPWSVPEVDEQPPPGTKPVRSPIRLIAAGAGTLLLTGIVVAALAR